MAGHPEDQYRDSTQLTQWTLWLLYAQIVFTAAALWSGLLERNLLLDMQAGAFESDEAMMAAAGASDRRQEFIGFGQSGVFIASGVLILMWIYRSSYNTSIKARYMEFTPGWSVGWYFVPIMMIWKPFQAMKEIWRNTAEQAGDSSDSWEVLLGVWWFLWIAGNLVANAAFRMTHRADGVGELIAANLVTMWSDVLSLPLLAVFIMMVRKLTALQKLAFVPEPAATPATA